MNKISVSSGILTNVSPLNAEEVKALEKRALDENTGFVYLDENHKVCFTGAISPETIKELAWHNVYELSKEENIFTKKVYAKTGTKTFNLINTLKKQSYDDIWSEITSSRRVLNSIDGKVPAGCMLMTVDETVYSTGDELPQLQEPFTILTTDEELQTYVLLQKGFQSLDEARAYVRLLLALLLIPGLEEIDELPEEFWQDIEIDLLSIFDIGTGLTAESFVPATPTLFWGLVSYDIGMTETTRVDKLYSEIFGIPMSVIMPGIFEDKEITHFTFPGSVDVINPDILSHNESLTEVIIENGVTSIGDFAFSSCPSITSINIPGSVTSIGESAFADCTALTSINIPNSVTSIGYYAFFGCSSLTSINIPGRITTIEESLFHGCTNLQSVYIPGSVTSIGYYAFRDCSSLTSINIPNSVTSIGDSAFVHCISLTSIVLPESVTSIGNQAFYGCSSLNELRYGGTVAEWNRVTLGTKWNYNIPATKIICTDGTVNI